MEPGAGVPAHRSRLPKAQVQLSLMALYLLPDASLCSFLRISSILAFPEPGHRPGERAEDAPRRPLRSSPSRSAATDESRRFHAAGHVSPAATPVATPAGSGALPQPGDAGGCYFLFLAQADLGDRASSKGGVSGSLPAGLRRREPLIHCESGGQRVGRGLVACAHYLRATQHPCLWRLATPWGPGTKTVIQSLNSKQLVPSLCQAEATQQGLCHMSACRKLT